MHWHLWRDARSGDHIIDLIEDGIVIAYITVRYHDTRRLIWLPILSRHPGPDRPASSWVQLRQQDSLECAMAAIAAVLDYQREHDCNPPWL